jgi:hypothetical protein
LGDQLGSGAVTAKGTGLFSADLLRLALVDPQDSVAAFNVLKMTLDLEGAFTNKTGRL